MDTAVVAAELRRLEGLPAPVVDWKVEQGIDSLGTEALWVWAVLDDGDLRRDVRNAVREAVRTKVAQMYGGPDPWVYVRFRAVSEV